MHLLFIIVFYFYFTYAQLCYCCSVLYFNWMLLFLCAAYCPLLRNHLLYMNKGIMFPSLTVSTLYGTIIETWFGSLFRFAVIMNHLLLKNRIYIHFVNMVFFFVVLVWSWMVLFLPLLQTSLKWLTLPHFTPIGQTLSGWIAGTTITATLLHGHVDTCLWFLQIVSLYPIYCLYLVKLFCLT